MQASSLTVVSWKRWRGTLTSVLRRGTLRSCGGQRRGPFAHLSPRSPVGVEEEDDAARIVGVTKGWAAIFVGGEEVDGAAPSVEVEEEDGAAFVVEVLMRCQNCRGCLFNRRGVIGVLSDEEGRADAMRPGQCV